MGYRERWEGEWRGNGDEERETKRERGRKKVPLYMLATLLLPIIGQNEDERSEG